MKRFLPLVVLIALCLRVGAEDVGPFIQGAPSTTVLTLNMKSNTVYLYKFMTGRSSNIPVNYPWSVTTSNRIQYNGDGTTSTVQRGLLYDFLEVSNFTTYTVYILPNCGEKLVNGEYLVSESSPRLSNTYNWTRLDPATSAYPFRVSLNQGIDSRFLPMYNMGILIYHPSFTAWTNVTSGTLKMIGG